MKVLFALNRHIKGQIGSGLGIATHFVARLKVRMGHRSPTFQVPVNVAVSRRIHGIAVLDLHCFAMTIDKWFNRVESRLRSLG